MSEKTSAPYPINDFTRTYAERLAHEAEERLQKRRLELAEQSASENSPAVRIRAWERTHALRLPNDPAHPIVPGVAICTGLTVAQVQEEQSVRRIRRTGAENREPLSKL